MTTSAEAEIRGVNARHNSSSLSDLESQTPGDGGCGWWSESMTKRSWWDVRAGCSPSDAMGGGTLLGVEPQGRQPEDMRGARWLELLS